MLSLQCTKVRIKKTLLYLNFFQSSLPRPPAACSARRPRASWSVPDQQESRCFNVSFKQVLCITLDGLGGGGQDKDGQSLWDWDAIGVRGGPGTRVCSSSSRLVCALATVCDSVMLVWAFATRGKARRDKPRTRVRDLRTWERQGKRRPGYWIKLQYKMQ